MADWKKTADGRWIPTQAPARPPRPGTGGAKATPIVRVGEPEGLTAKFIANPLKFMRERSVNPPSSSGIPELGKVLNERRINADLVAEGLNDGPINAKVTHRMGGGTRFIKFAPYTNPNFPASTTFTFPDNGKADGGTLPIHWLPWESLQIISLQIPAVPSSEVEPDPVTHPNVFFTAAINGCSVFVQGDPTTPVISHGGIDGKLAVAAKGFWEDQMVAAGVSSPAKPIRGQVSTTDYMKGAAIDNQIKQYIDWLQEGHSRDFTLTYFAPFGCVFGLRYGRYWTFYLQKNFVMRRTVFHKESSIVSTGPNQYKHKETGQVATVTGTELVKSYLGPINIRSKMRNIYGTSTNVSRPMEVGEIFPNCTVSTDLRPRYQVS